MYLSSHLFLPFSKGEAYSSEDIFRLPLTFQETGFFLIMREASEASIWHIWPFYLVEGSSA